MSLRSASAVRASSRSRLQLLFGVEGGLRHFQHRLHALGREAGHDVGRDAGRDGVGTCVVSSSVKSTMGRRASRVAITTCSSVSRAWLLR
jgi:hypothetical protein